MIRKSAIGLEIDASRNVGSEGQQYLFGIEATSSVSCIDCEFEVCEGFGTLFGAQSVANHIAQVFGILIEVVAIGNASTTVDFFVIQRKGENIGDVLAFESALFCKKFESVTIIRMVTCRDRKCGITALMYRGHEHSRGGAKPTTDN